MAVDRRPVLLVLRALGLGDFLTGLPAFRALGRAFPAHRFVLAAPDELEPLADLVPEIDEVEPTPGLGPIRRDGPTDLAVNLHGRGPESHRVLLALSPRRLVAFRSPEVPETRWAPRFDRHEHEVWRWCRLLKECGIPADPHDLALDVPDPAIEEPGYAIVHPGAASPARRWPPARYARVAQQLAREGRRVLVTGSQKERDLARRLADEAGLPDDAVLAGRLDLRGLATLVRDASLLVCGDTGVAHLATALSTPSVVLFGPTPPWHWGPPPGRRRHRAIHHGGSGDPHADRVDPRLLRIHADEVLHEIAQLERELAREARWAEDGAAARP